MKLNNHLFDLLLMFFTFNAMILSIIYYNTENSMSMIFGFLLVLITLFLIRTKELEW